MPVGIEEKAEIVGEMEMEKVIFEIGQVAKMLFQPGYGKILPSDIHHQTALWVVWPVAGHTAANVRALRQQLEQRARAIKNAVVCARADRHAIADFHALSLIAEFAII